MRQFRRLSGLGGLARNLALFAVLLQFTLPFAIAAAADLSPGADPAAVFDCLGGRSGDPETSNRGWHGCALPGGCCVPGGSAAMPAFVFVADGGTVAAAGGGFHTEPSVQRIVRQNPVRGPPVVTV